MLVPSRSTEVSRISPAPSALIKHAAPDRIAGIANVDEVDSFDDAPVTNVEARDDSLGNGVRYDHARPCLGQTNATIEQRAPDDARTDTTDTAERDDVA